MGQETQKLEEKWFKKELRLLWKDIEAAMKYGGHSAEEMSMEL